MAHIQSGRSKPSTSTLQRYAAVVGKQLRITLVLA